MPILSLPTTRLIRPILLCLLSFGLSMPALAQIPLMRSSGPPDERPKELEIQFDRAEAAWRSGSSLLEAKARVDDVLRSLPDDTEALRLRAQILMALERPEEALSDARRCVRLDPEDGQGHLLLSEAAWLTGAHELALSSLARAEEYLPARPDVYVRLAQGALLLGALDEAERLAEAAYRLDPNSPSACYQLARVLVLQERPDDAADVLLGGLRRSLVSPVVLRRDSVLARLAGHPRLVGSLD